MGFNKEIKTIREVKDDLHKMYPQYSGFIEHTLVANMCNLYHIEQSRKVAIEGKEAISYIGKLTEEVITNK